MRRAGVGLPVTWQPGLYVEAIDASCSDLVYEGFNSLRNLIFLKVSDRGKSLKKRRATLKGNENISPQKFFVAVSKQIIANLF